MLKLCAKHNVQRYELSKTWDLYDTNKRLRCISDKNIKDYTALKDCLERDAFGTVTPSR